jgi:hypothetical protein
MAVSLALMAHPAQTRTTHRLTALSDEVTQVAKTVILPAAGLARLMMPILNSTAFHIRFWPGGGAVDAAYNQGPADRAVRAWTASCLLTLRLAPDQADPVAVRHQNPLPTPEPAR